MSWYFMILWMGLISKSGSWRRCPSFCLSSCTHTYIHTRTDIGRKTKRHTCRETGSKTNKHIHIQNDNYNYNNPFSGSSFKTTQLSWYQKKINNRSLTPYLSVALFNIFNWFSPFTMVHSILLVEKTNNYYYYYICLTAFFSRTTWVSRHQKGKPFLILLEQEMMRWQWHQLDHYANDAHFLPDR